MSAMTANDNQESQTENQEWDDPQVALMLRVKRDDGGAFAELLRYYWPQVFGRFYRRLGDRQEAEDLAQEVFLRIYRHRQSYQPRARFATWLFHISANVLRNALRTRRRRPSRRLASLAGAPSADLSFESLVPCRGEAPWRLVERAEVVSVVRAAVASLGPRQRTALALHQFEARTCAEVGARMRVSPKAAKSLLYRARTQLRARLTSFMQA